MRINSTNPSQSANTQITLTSPSSNGQSIGTTAYTVLPQLINRNTTIVNITSDHISGTELGVGWTCDFIVKFR
jgi:hypothetical protein